MILTPLQKISVSCPGCSAAPGKPCTRPTNTGRAIVPWTHYVREHAAREAVETQEKIS